jgi:hypothetical protein
MALNQTIFSPLTNIEGSLSSFTSPSGSALQIVSSSLPSYQATGWQYKILTTLFGTTSTTQVNVTDLQLTLANSKKYIINGFLFGSSVDVTFGLRVNIATANTEAYYAIENPSTATSIVYGFNALANTGNSPSSALTNYCLIQLRAIAITAASGVATFTPTISSEGGNGGGIGPSVIYYREY